MKTQPQPPSSTPATSSSLPKIRLMCSYGGHIVHRPHNKSLFYAGGETRIVAIDRRTTAASLAAQLSRTLFENRPFLLKYQLPHEDLDSLISVITDEDLANMLEEHDRITPPARLRLFLFAVKPEPVGEPCFSDALMNTVIWRKGQSTECGLLLGMGSDFYIPAETGSNSGGGSCGGETKLGAKSLVLETSSSFGSTSSSFSMSNSPPTAVTNCNQKAVNLLDRKNKFTSSPSFESGNSGVSQEPLIEVGVEESSENPMLEYDKTIQLLGYPPNPLSQFPDGKKQHTTDTSLHQGGLQFMPQYAAPLPIPPYYSSMYHISSPPNQPYPSYLVPTQYHNIPIPSPSTSITVAAGPVEHQITSEPAKPTAIVYANDGSEFDEDIAYNQIYKTQPSVSVLPSHYQTMTTGTTALS